MNFEHTKSGPVEADSVPEMDHPVRTPDDDLADYKDTKSDRKVSVEDKIENKQEKHPEDADVPELTDKKAPEISNEDTHKKLVSDLKPEGQSNENNLKEGNKQQNVDTIDPPKSLENCDENKDAHKVATSRSLNSSLAAVKNRSRGVNPLTGESKIQAFMKKFNKTHKKDVPKPKESEREFEMMPLTNDESKIKHYEKIDAMIAQKPEFEEIKKDEVLVSPQPHIEVENFSSEHLEQETSFKKNDQSYEDEQLQEAPSDRRLSFSSPKRKSSMNKMSKPRRSSNFGGMNASDKSREYLTIKDPGNKEARDHKDAKASWTPNEVRTDIVQKIKEQIKAAFGAKMEADCFSMDFKKHINCLKTFETVFEPDFPDIDGFF